MKLLAALMVCALAPLAHADRLEGRLRVQPRGSCSGAAHARVAPALAPVAKAKLEIVAGAKNSPKARAARVVTADDGTFSVDLAPGTYCVIRAGRPPSPKKTRKYHADSCEVAAWEKCDRVVEVPTTTSVDIEVYEPCVPPCSRTPPPP